MSKIKQYYKTMTIIVFILLAASTVSAQSSCEAKVTYKWKHSEGEREETTGSFIGKGVTEAEAKAQLKGLLEKAKKDAASLCKETHENLSGCMANRYGKLGSSYNTMAFGVRKQMDEAVKSDCEKSQGQCLAATSTEEPCVTVEVAKSEDVAADSGKEQKDKKDTKK
jgi:hypothetical protein